MKVVVLVVEPALVVKFILANPDLTEAGVRHVMNAGVVPGTPGSTLMTVALTSLKVNDETVPPSLPPVIVTLSPPSIEPLLGVTRVMLGTSVAALYVNADVLVAVPPGVVTDTFTVAAACAGAVQVIWVALKMVADTAVVSKVTVAGPIKFVPVMVTERPPFTEPIVGDTVVIVGAAAVVTVTV